MKTSIDTEQLKANINLIDLAGRYTELRRVSSKEWHGPCPWCGGDDRFVVTADHFFCRPEKGHCGREGDAIEFVIQKRGVDFKEAVSFLGGNMTDVGERVRPVQHKPTESTVKPLDDNRARKLMEAHRKLVNQSDGVSRRCMAYLADRGITIDTISAFSVGCETAPLPGTWDHESKKTIQPYKNGVAIQAHQWAISLPWFNHDGALVAVKYRFIESHIYTVNGKEQSGTDGKGQRFTSSGPVRGNAFGWQCLQGPSKVDVIFIVEGEINALSLWQAGGGAIDVLSVGGDQSNKVLPPTVVAKAKEYKHRFTWFDEREKTDNFALQIDATAMQSPLWKDEQGNQLYRDDGKVKRKDANDFLQAGKLGALLTAMLGRLGVSLPAESPVSQPVTESRTDDTPPSRTGVRSEPTATNTQLIQEAQPFDFNFEPEATPAVDKVAALAEQLRAIAALPSFDDRLNELEPLHPAIGALSYTEVRDPSIVAELLKIFKGKQSSVDAFLKKYGAKEPEAQPIATEPALNVHTDHPSKFVGMVVSDDDMYMLYYRAHKLNLRLTSEPQGKTQPCNHLVKSCGNWTLS